MSKSIKKSFIYLLTALVFLCQMSLAQQTVTWTDTQGVSVSGNTITKTAATGWGNAGATSVKSLYYATDGWVETTVTETTVRSIGLSEINVDHNSSSDYSILFDTYNTQAYVFENGVNVGSMAVGYSPGHTFRIERTGSTVEYSHQGNVIYTSTKQSISKLVVDVAFYTTNSTLNNVTVSNSFIDLNTETPTPGQQTINWTNANNLLFVDQKILKTTASGWGDAGAESEDYLSFATDGWVKSTAYETNTNRAFGLSTINTDDGNTAEYSILLSSNSMAYVFEDGVEKHSNVPYTPGTEFKIERVGTEIRYFKDSESTPFYTSLSQSNSQLIVDISFVEKYSTLDQLSISSSFIDSNSVPPSSSQDINWIKDSGIQFSGSKIYKTLPTQWGNAGAESEDYLGFATDGWVKSIAYETNTNRAFGLSTTNADDGNTAEYSILLSNNSLAYVFENGVEKHSNVPYTLGTEFRIERIGTDIRYFKDNESTPFHTAVSQSTSRLIVDISFYDQNSSLDQVEISDSFITGTPTAQGGHWNKNENTVYYENAVAIGRNDIVDDYLLAIEGKVLAKGVKVTLDGWADFVFEDKYYLTTLKDLESYIKRNGHLPDVPSEKEVMKNGINLGEMNTKLLQKIEELTLYLIDQNKQLQKQKLRIEQLEKNAKVSKK